MSKIKLYKIGEINGVIRLQSQLAIGKDSADFIIDTDGKLKCWGYVKGAVDFYECNEPYEIVSNKSDMYRQEISKSNNNI